MAVPRLGGKLLSLLLSATLATTLLSACRPPNQPPPPITPPSEAPNGAPATVDEWLTYLTLEEKVGQLLWMGLPGPSMTDESQQLLAGGKAGGFIFFGRQGSDPAVLTSLTAELQAAAAGRERHTPGLLISIDQEGGRVQRLGPPFTPWPGSMALGATGSAEYADAVARAMARELRAVGINLNLAPDADVNNNPANPVIGIRSFGEDPVLVARLVAAQVRGFQAEQVGAVAKHFPGHGDTDLDSHLDLPTVPHPWERLDRVELVPFRAAIAAGVDGVMSAHITFPAVATDGLPATLSPRVLTGLLKERMGYTGVVITDAIDGMKAITDRWGVEEAMVMALQAGADMLLVTESFGKQQPLHGAVVKAVQEGRIPVARIDDATRRVLTLKGRLGLLPKGSPGASRGGTAAAGQRPAQGTSQGGTRSEGSALIGAPAHRELSDRVGREALTLVRNAHLPLTLAAEERVLVIGPAYGPLLNRGDGVLTPLGAGVKTVHGNVVEIALDRRPDPAAIGEARRLAAQAAAVVYGVYNGHDYPDHQAFIRELIATGKPVVVVGLGMPYELTAIPEIGTYIAAYGYQEPNLNGVGDLLFGKAQARGRLPVSIPGLYPVGHGL